ncbi:hypothetical protein WH5701_16425 [Synechococcus sp. WH 5701]|nr:hypothetical protein WH5701_16425 [Synechococcus sp. WH 5701]
MVNPQRQDVKDLLIGQQGNQLHSISNLLKMLCRQHSDFLSSAGPQVRKN